jgi:hypothetical protein
MFSAIHPTADISSGHLESVPLHLDDPGMRPGLRDRPGRSLDQQLQLAIGAAGKSLDDCGGQDTLALSPVLCC